MGENLIFLISQPRAGSTLLQKILISHNKIVSTGEPWLLLPFFHSVPSNFFLAKNKEVFDKTLCNEAINEFFKIYSKSEEVKQGAIASLINYIYSSFPEMNEESYFLDKTPRYYYIMEKIYQYFPKAKIIVLIRNPLATLHSTLDTWVKNDYFNLQLYKDDFFVATRNILDFVKKYENSNRVQIIKYEDYILNSEKELSELCNFLDIENNIDVSYYNDKNKWKLGDNKVYSNNKIIEKNINNWKESPIFKKPQNWKIAMYFMRNINQEYFEKFDYNYNESLEIINKLKPSKLKLLFTFPTKILLHPKVKPIGKLQEKINRFIYYIKSYGVISFSKSFIKSKKSKIQMRHIVNDE